MKEAMDWLAYQMVPDEQGDLLMPEERLMVAVFDRALRDMLFPEKTTPRHVINSARRYFKNTKSNYLHSFGYLCLHFGLCQNEVRRLIFSKEERERLLFLTKTSRRRGL